MQFQFRNIIIGISKLGYRCVNGQQNSRNVELVENWVETMTDG